MAQWGRNDQAVTANSTTTKETSNGAPIGTYTRVKGDQVNRVDGANAHFGNTSVGSRAYTDVNMFGNTTVGAFQPNKAVGVFAVNTAQLQVSGGNVVISRITSGGSGYSANATVTFTATNGGSGASANAAVVGGRVTAINITAGGNSYITAPTVAISAPTVIAVNGNTAISNDTITMTTANSFFLVDDQVTVGGNATSAPAGQFINNALYYVVLANTTALKISFNQGGTPITMVKASGNSTTGGGLGFTGTTATGYVDTNSVLPQVAHAGWVLRTEGTGGRAGRVQYETLVAMGSLGETDGKYGTAASISSNTVDQYV
jgi:hypothetical protein